MKMVHNGIEYGLMQAYAEGFEIMHASEYPLDLAAVAKAWQHGTVIRSWLLELAGRAFERTARTSTTSGAGSPTRARAAGRSRRPSTSTCRRRSSRSRCSRASAPARRRATAPRCWRRSATSSAATPCGRSRTGSRRDRAHEAPRSRPDARRASATAPIRQLRLSGAGRKRKTSGPVEPNPLREGLRLERIPEPCLLVIFGATGDLSHRKILPALYNLRRAGLLPPEFRLVAFARGSYDDEKFGREMRASVAEHSRVKPVEDALWDDFAKRIFYQRGDFDRPDDFDRLAERLEQIDAAPGTRGNLLFYLATPPSAYPEIVGHLGRVGLDHETHEGGWRRIVIEKPFGHDLESGDRLNDAVSRSSTSRRSTASTTTWARRPSATCWSSGSATASSSRSGTAATSTTCRSPWPRRWGSRAAASSTRRPGAAATSSRTTCSSC